MGLITQSFNSSSITNHPYYPLEVEIASYLANEWSTPVLLGVFASVCSAVLLATLVIVNKVHPNLSGSEKAVSGGLFFVSFLNWYVSILPLTI